ncbi:MAG: SLBB domain-containing protein [Pseudomonadota bacterium]
MRMNVQFPIFLTLALVMLCLASDASAQISGLTPEQQRLLQQLPPNQRQALLNRFIAQQGAAPVQQPESGVDDAALLLDTEAESDTSDSDEPPRFAAGDSLVVFATRPEDAADDPDIERAIELIAAANPYRLDERGVLPVPGTAGVPIAGLTEALAEVRLAADPLLAGLIIEVVLLPLERYGEAALEPYGYDLFRTARRGTTMPSQPVPTSYVVGPGDKFQIQFYGAQNATYELPVGRDGIVNLPELGPVTVVGLSFDSVRADLERRVSEQLIGTEVSVTLTELRSVQVFLAGDVETPGAYSVTALSTILDVLARGGGILPSGSLRDVRLNRNGQTVGTFDLYQLLLFGNASGNRRVQDGDVVFVAPVGPRVSVSGAVGRPAIYEVRNSLDARGALLLAGGAQAQSLLSSARLQRIDPRNGLAVVGLDLTNDAGLATALRDGDLLVVPGDTEQVDLAVQLTGHVYRPGLYDWSEGMRLSQLLSSSRDVRPEADTGYVLIERQASPNSEIEVLSADIAAIWRKPSVTDDPLLAARDRVYVFSRTADQGRAVYLPEILQRLRRQSRSGEPAAIVRVGGFVNQPGEYPLEVGMAVSDLLRAGGGLAESAYPETAELSRFSLSGAAERRTHLVDIDLAAVLGLDAAADVALRAADYLNIRQISRWSEQELIELRGEVRFPGEYPVSQGETLSSVLQRAGGLTDFAFPEGSVFTRVALREREREQLDTLANRIESDLAALALSDTAQTEALTIGRSLLAQIENTEPAGRLVIDLESVLTSVDGRDIFVRDGDVLFVPPRSQEVTVIGEVQYATSHLWEPSVTRDDYIDRSGGVTVKADERRIYVVRANGEVVVSNRSRFFSRSRGFDIRPGDTIVVPLDTDRVKPLVLWSSATQILYNLAIAAAAVNSF